MHEFTLHEQCREHLGIRRILATLKHPTVLTALFSLSFYLRDL